MICKRSRALVLEKSFEQKRVSVAESRNVVPRDRTSRRGRRRPFSLPGLLSHRLLPSRGSFFYANVASSLSIQSSFFSFPDCRGFSTFLPFFFFHDPFLFVFVSFVFLREPVRPSTRFISLELFRRLSPMRDARISTLRGGTSGDPAAVEKHSSTFFFALKLVRTSRQLLRWNAR